MTGEPSRPGARSPVTPPGEPPRAPAVAAVDPMAVHRDPSRRFPTGPGTIAARARVHADYEWLRLADLGPVAAQEAIGRGISLERDVMRRTRRLPGQAVFRLAQRPVAATPTASPASASPAAASASEGVSF